MAEKKKSVTVYLSDETYEGLDLLCLPPVGADPKTGYKRAALVREIIEWALTENYVPARHDVSETAASESNDPPKIPSATHPAEPKTEGIPESLAAVLE